MAMVSYMQTDEARATIGLSLVYQHGHVFFGRRAVVEGRPSHFIIS
jgi:hypothetical protein